MVSGPRRTGRIGWAEMRQIIPKQRTSRSGAGMEVIKRPGKKDLEEDSTPHPHPS